MNTLYYPEVSLIVAGELGTQDFLLRSLSITDPTATTREGIHQEPKNE